MPRGGVLGRPHTGRPKLPEGEQRIVLQAYVKRRTALVVKRLAEERAQSVASLVDQICEEWVARQEEDRRNGTNEGESDLT